MEVYHGKMRQWILVVVCVLCSLGLFIILRSREQRYEDHTHEDSWRETETGGGPAGIATAFRENIAEEGNGGGTENGDIPSVRSKPLAMVEGGIPESLMPHQMREELRELQPSLSELGREHVKAPFSELEFPLFDDKRVRFTNVAHRTLGKESGVFTARVAGDAKASHVVLSYVRGAVSGTIHSPSKGLFFEIRNASGENQSYLSEINPEEMPECGTCSH